MEVMLKSEGRRFLADRDPLNGQQGLKEGMEERGEYHNIMTCMEEKTRIIPIVLSANLKR